MSPSPQRPGTPGAAGLAEALAAPVPPLRPDAATDVASERFLADPAPYALAIVDADGTPIGLLNPFKFLELLSRPFGRDLVSHRTVAMVMGRAPLVVDEHVPLEQLSDLMVDDATRYIFDGFIVTRHGRCLGIGTGYTLMRRLAEGRQQELFHLAHHDALTGLPNRLLLADRLGQALVHARRYDAAWVCCVWISTGSRSSTTPTVMAPTISCCAASPSAC